MSARNQKFFGGEARDDFVASFGDDDLFFDAGCAPSIASTARRSPGQTPCPA